MEMSSSNVGACMNAMCTSSFASSSSSSSSNLVEWKKGWPLQSGGFATLCQNCWRAYEQLTFCQLFHSDETGWRECTSCGKRLHCGCIASNSFLDLLDTGGVNCKACSSHTIPLSNLNRSCIGPSKDYYDTFRENTSTQNLHDKSVLLVPTIDLTISLSAPSNPTALSGGLNAEETQLSIGMSSFQHSTSSISRLRVARPPVEGRIKNQLLPRYWPRITDQELQQISGDSNSTIVPLFEKALSASDAGRIGRLVLPKACAEAYFPPISQPEGIPVRIQDVKGKEWVFQFRFWPNNNSRMYVLEGVTPCIQSMQLQAGDTVTFSRMDPEGKLLMGFRKASKTTSVHKVHDSVAFQGERLPGNAENQLATRAYSEFFRPLKGSTNSSLDGDNNLVLQPMMLLPERKRRNIGPKSKRLRTDDHDSTELTLTWEEVQDLLRTPPTVSTSTFSVEDHDSEEFNEPPVLGKRSIVIVRLSGEQEQWTQCDSCFKWRKTPIDFLHPSKWTRQDDNVYDRTRCSCSTPDELSSMELENMLKRDKDLTNMRFQRSFKPLQEHESPDPLIDTTEEFTATTTTKHPRHRPGCSCIVCIQPPSGKGKHKPTCICNVCATVKRRFKTLMMRKKKRQSEREAEIAQGTQIGSTAAKEETTEIDNNYAKRSESEVLLRCPSEGRSSQENADIFKGGLDLNCCPGQENTALFRVSMMSLLQEASLPLETYLKQNGLTSLVPVVEKRAIAQEQVEDHNAVIQEHELEDGSNEFSEKDQRKNDP